MKPTKQNYSYCGSYNASEYQSKELSIVYQKIRKVVWKSGIVRYSQRKELFSFLEAGGRKWKGMQRGLFPPLSISIDAKNTRLPFY